MYNKQVLNVEIMSFRAENGSHLLLYLLRFDACHLGKAFCGVGVDDGTGTIDDESAVVVPPILAHLFQAAALCADAGDEQEVVGCQAPDVSEG